MVKGWSYTAMAEKVDWSSQSGCHIGIRRWHHTTGQPGGIQGGQTGDGDREGHE